MIIWELLSYCWPVFRTKPPGTWSNHPSINFPIPSRAVGGGDSGRWNDHCWSPLAALHRGVTTGVARSATCSLNSVVFCTTFYRNNPTNSHLLIDTTLYTTFCALQGSLTFLPCIRALLTLYPVMSLKLPCFHTMWHTINIPHKEGRKS